MREWAKGQARKATLVSARRGVLSLAVLLALGVLPLAGACSGDDDEPSLNVGEEPPPTGAVEVSVTYPDEVAESVTAVVHAWVLAEREGARVDPEREPFNCASLIGGTLDPYDLTLVRRADVASTEDVTKVTAEQVAPGAALVYVEAGTFGGQVELAGCSSVEVGSTTVGTSITLSPAKVFDCSDPETEDGSPCDDGLVCTVGETCNDGACGDATPRDCTFAADSCHAASCGEERGCVVTALADGTPCDDALFCTQGDVCGAGECLGSARDCADDAGACQVAVTCDEENDACVINDAPFGTGCDDGLFCTEGDTCDGLGTCQGSVRNCGIALGVLGDCQIPSCDEAAGQCVAGNAPLGTSCSDTDNCTTGDQCDGAGTCGGAPVVCGGVGDDCTEDVCNPVTGLCGPQSLTSGEVCALGDAGTGTCNVSGVCE